MLMCAHIHSYGWIWNCPAKCIANMQKHERYSLHTVSIHDASYQLAVELLGLRVYLESAEIRSSRSNASLVRPFRSLNHVGRTHDMTMRVHASKNLTVAIHTPDHSAMRLFAVGTPSIHSTPSPFSSHTHAFIHTYCSLCARMGVGPP